MAASGSTSGSGLASANTIGVAGHGGDVAAGQDARRGQPDEHVGAPDRARPGPRRSRRSWCAPRSSAGCRSGSAGPGARRPGRRRPRCRRLAPAPSSSLSTAVPAAPAPAMATRTSGSFLPTTRSALVSAASTTIAVPCWSSWNTGMSSSSRSLASTSKQRGALMSSRLMPPNPGAISCTAADDLVGVLGVQADRPGVDAGEPLEQGGLALHHRQRGVRPDVAQAEHGRAVGDHGHRVPLDGEAAGVLAVPGDRHRDPAHARGVRHGQVVPVPQRYLGPHLDLPAEVQQEGPVADLVHGHAVDGGQRAHQGLAVLCRPARRR